MEIINFTPFSAFIGGILIGLAAFLLLLLNGRIFGISGIVSQIFSKDRDNRSWRISIVLGLLAGAFLIHIFIGTPEKMETVSNIRLTIGGILVGIGTRLGSGCTSGHGVCGISRLSMRSIMATLNFMVWAIITVSIFGSGFSN